MPVFNPPLPRRRPASRGFATTDRGAGLWASLDPHSRLLFLQELLASRPNLNPVAGVNYDPNPPLLEDTATGAVVGIDGSTILTGDGALSVDITRGTFAESTGNNLLLWLTLAGLVVVAIATGGRSSAA